MYSYETVTEAVNELQKRGYEHNFNIKDDCIHCDKKGVSLLASEFVIDEVYRFEGDSDPGDEMVVYAISSEQLKIKGVLVNAYGTYSETASSDLIKKLTINHPH
jgi:hypothetical protein